MNESHLRSVIKAITWRVLGTLSTVLMVFVMTRALTVSLAVGVAEFFSKVILFYVHERLWSQVGFGIKSTQEDLLTEGVEITSLNPHITSR
jgi:adenylylsulfate kinase